MRSTYIMGDDSGYVKIGRSKNVEKRFKELSTGNPTLKLLCEKDEDIEERLHRTYSLWNVPSLGKEWFDLTEEQIEILISKEHFYIINEDDWEAFLYNKKQKLSK